MAYFMLTCPPACLSITTAVIITMVDVAIERPIGSTSIDVFKQTSFTTAFLPVVNIAFAYCKDTSTIQFIHDSALTR